MTTMERVFLIMRVLVNEEDTALEEIVVNFGKEEGGDQGQGGDKLEVQECEPPRGAKGVVLYFILAVI